MLDRTGVDHSKKKIVEKGSNVMRLYPATHLSFVLGFLGSVNTLIDDMPAIFFLHDFPLRQAGLTSNSISFLTTLRQRLLRVEENDGWAGHDRLDRISEFSSFFVCHFFSSFFELVQV